MSRRDAEPDFDEPGFQHLSPYGDPIDEYDDIEGKWCGDLCSRCGHDGHQAKGCPHVNALTLPVGSPKLPRHPGPPGARSGR